MTIKTKIEIAGTEYSDYQNLRVSRSIGDNNSSSNFRVVYDSPSGRHDDDWNVGDEVIVYANKDSAPTTILFTGILEKIKFKGKENTQNVTLTGRDYSARLQDIKVEPIVYSNSEISTIVENIMDEAEINDITTTNVNVTTTTLQRIAFSQNSIFDAFTQLAKLSGFIFYVDENKDLHFEEKNAVSSGITLDNTNILKTTFNQTREGMANRVWVYGGRQLAGFREELVTGSPDPQLGSVYTLLNKPHNTLVEYLGTPQRGGIFEMVTEADSGTNYLVNYEDKELIFTSGTNIGDSVPVSGGSLVITYDREVPIAKMGTDWVSIGLYGRKDKIITDTSIKDPTTAEEILKKELEDSNPFKGMEVEYEGWTSITPGNTVDIVLSDFGIDDTVGILDITYTFDKNRIQSERVIKLRLDKKINDVTDVLTEMRRKVDVLESDNRKGTDILARLETAIGSVLVVGSRWYISTSTATGSVSYLYDTGFTPPINPFHLASGTTQGILAGSFTGSAVAYSALAIQVSGGYSY